MCVCAGINDDTVCVCVLGRWFQEQGALVVNVNADSEGLEAHETLNFSFQLLNPQHSRKVSRDIRVQVRMCMSSTGAHVRALTSNRAPAVNSFDAMIQAGCRFRTPHAMIARTLACLHTTL